MAYLRWFPLRAREALTTLPTEKRAACVGPDDKPHDLLRLAWELLQQNNETARQNENILRILRRVTTDTQQQDRLLKLSYVPTAIFDTLSVRRLLREDRQLLAPLIRQARTRDERSGAHPHETNNLAMMPLDNERSLWGELFLIGHEVKISRQPVWHLVFYPLVEYLRHFDFDHPKRSHRKSNVTTILPDVLFRCASALVHCRYPQYWPHKPTLVKARVHSFPTA